MCVGLKKARHGVYFFLPLFSLLPEYFSFISLGNQLCTLVTEHFIYNFSFSSSLNITKDERGFSQDLSAGREILSKPKQAIVHSVSAHVDQSLISVSHCPEAV